MSDVQPEIHLVWRNIVFARQFVRALKDIYLGLHRVLNISGYGSVCLSNTWICFNVFYYARTWLNIAEFPWICLSKLFWLHLIILDIWQCFEYAYGIQYVRVLNMPWYSYNNSIIIVTNVVLEFLSARFVHLDDLRLTILSFFCKRESEHKTNSLS